MGVEVRMREEEHKVQERDDEGKQQRTKEREDEKKKGNWRFEIGEVEAEGSEENGSNDRDIIG